MTFKHHSKPDLTPEDIARSLELVRALPSAQAEWESDLDGSFKAFAKEVLGLEEQAILTPMEAAYCLAGYYLQIEETEDETVIDIGELACELESPEDVVGRPVEPEWHKLASLINNA